MGFCLSRPRPGPSHELDFGPAPVRNPPHTMKDTHSGTRPPLFFPADEDLPDYPDPDRSKAVFIRLFQEAKKKLGLLPLLRREFHVYLDDNFRQDAKAQRCMQLYAACLLLLGEAHQSNMSFFFTNHSNSDSAYVSRKKFEMAQELEKLFKTSSWDEALAIVRESQSLQDVGFQKWISDLVGGEEQKKVMERMSDFEMHNRLLARAREEKIRVWEGWRAQDLTQQKLLDVYRKAVKESQAQPKLRNSVRFTIERAIALHLRQSEDEESHPTNIILLTASSLELKEKEMLKNRLKGVKGGGSEFSIQVVLFNGNLTPDVMKYHHELDDQQSGDRDIYSAISFDETRVLHRGLGPQALQKILNGHSREFTRMGLSEDEKYGNHTGGPFKLPTVAEVQEALELATTEPDNEVLGFSNSQVIDLKDASDGKV